MEKIDFYELAKLKVSEDFAKGLLKMIEDEVSKKYLEKEKQIANKDDISRLEIKMAQLETKMAQTEVSIINRLTNINLITALVQLLGLAGAVFAIIKTSH